MRKGQEGISSIGVVAAIVLVLLAVFVLVRPLLAGQSSVSLTLTKAESGAKYASCVLRSGLLPESGAGVCPISPLDKDGDCCKDSIDFCVFPEEVKDKTGIEAEQARGSNQCDADGDGMPDVCDEAPANDKVASCKANAETGKCTQLSAKFKSAPFACEKKPFNAGVTIA